MTKIAIIACFIAAALWLLMWQGRQYKHFLDGAKKVTGVVTDKQIKHPNPDIPSRKENWLFYSYEVDGRSFEGKDRVEFGDLWEGFSQGQEIAIYYSEKSPSISYPASVLERRVSSPIDKNLGV